MHRFVNDFYRAPVAVNDLGLVHIISQLCLDLGGLASEKGPQPHIASRDAEAYRD